MITTFSVCFSYRLCAAPPAAVDPRARRKVGGLPGAIYAMVGIATVAGAHAVGQAWPALIAGLVMGAVLLTLPFCAHTLPASSIVESCPTH
jgi:hypothetical protein